MIVIKILKNTWINW